MIGSVYRIIHLQSDICYIGSTFNEPRKRWQQHKEDYHKWIKGKNSNVAIYQHFKEHGIDQFKMILIKEYEVCDRAHLEAFEQLWINKFRKTCVNKNNLIRIEKLYHKAYRATNRDKINEQKKAYYQANRDQISQKQKQYNAKNKDKINKRQKQYYEANKEKISVQNKQYYDANRAAIKEHAQENHNCDCGVNTQHHIKHVI